MIWTRWEDFSPHLKNAVLTAEDDMFYRHEGVDWEGTRNALAKDWEQKRLAFGGSTITQQVARKLYLSPSRNPLRKIKEFFIARRLERELGKRRIFELYLNIAEWGKGIFGAEAAARHYFRRPARDLTAAQSALLAVTLPDPAGRDPAHPSAPLRALAATIAERAAASAAYIDCLYP
jgi:monofunctional biosynthetic peptidoglycan transglycosylase